LTDFAHHEHTLTAILLDGHRDLGIAEVAVGELAVQINLEPTQRQARRADAADEGKREGAVGLDGEPAPEIRLIEHLNGEHILGANHVIGRGLRSQRRRRQHQQNREARAFFDAIARSIMHGQNPYATLQPMRSLS
jgi:hypothetical protein